MPLEHLLQKLLYYRLPNQLRSWIRTWLTQRCQRVIVDGECSDFVHVHFEVPQGAVLGPLMFLLYVNYIGEGISSNIKLFADDCLLYKPVNSLEDAQALQSDLDLLVDWSRTWQMSFNPVKCHTLRVSRLHSEIVNNYQISGTVLKSVSEHPYLGVHLSSILSCTYC